ncbi:MAG: tryptophan synthase subunit alpha, partial [Kofleriaceae bacterium]
MTTATTAATQVNRRGSLRAVFDQAARDRRAVLVAYLTFADPDPATSIEVLAACAEAGAGVIELGVPFSDPSADGPSIQRAMERALDAGGSLAGALDAVATLRGRGVTTPIVLFGYYNPIFVMGPEVFAARGAEVGLDAVLTVDLPIDEIAELAQPLAAKGIDVIPLVAP